MLGTLRHQCWVKSNFQRFGPLNQYEKISAESVLFRPSLGISVESRPLAIKVTLKVIRRLFWQ
jgi:hypothetical protein